MKLGISPLCPHMMDKDNYLNASIFHQALDGFVCFYESVEKKIIRKGI